MFEPLVLIFGWILGRPDLRFEFCMSQMCGICLCLTLQSHFNSKIPCFKHFIFDCQIDQEIDRNWWNWWLWSINQTANQILRVALYDTSLWWRTHIRRNNHLSAIIPLDTGLSSEDSCCLSLSLNCQLLYRHTVRCCSSAQTERRVAWFIDRVVPECPDRWAQICWKSNEGPASVRLLIPRRRRLQL